MADGQQQLAQTTTVIISLCNMKNINEKIDGLTVAKALRDLDIVKNIALLKEGRLSKAQDMVKAIKVITEDTSMLCEIMRLVWIKRSLGNDLESFALVENTWDKTFKEQLKNKYSNGRWFTIDDDKKSTGVLSYDDTIKLLEGYRLRALRAGKPNKANIFVKAAIWLRENRDESKFLCDYLHYLLGIKSGNSIPHSYRAKGWDDTYMSKLVKFGSQKLIFKGKEIE